VERANERDIPTVTGASWLATTIRNMFVRPCMCGMVIYRGEVRHAMRQVQRAHGRANST
jgi:acyl-coenzyme A thioesterase PaaI-like protein